jgi:hypothetical protein
MLRPLERRAVVGTAVVGVFMLTIAGCTAVGPGTINRDRPAYGESLADSWKDLMLLNVVKLRYADVPVFLDVAMLTRSMLEILGEVSTLVEVPQLHIEEGRTRATSPPKEGDLPIRIHSGVDKPDDSYAAIEYRDHWFWIDDTDFQSKRVFTFLMIMLSLAETGSTPAAPLLTVSTGG